MLDHVYQVIQFFFQSAELSRFILDWIVASLVISAVCLFFLRKLAANEAKTRRRTSLFSLILLLCYPFLLLWFDHHNWVYVEWGLAIGQWGDSPRLPEYAYPILVSIYLIIIGGAIALLMKLIFQIFSLSHLVKKLKANHSNDHSIRCDDSDEILIIENLTSPCVIGIHKPALLIPEEFHQQASPEDMDRMLTHESSHIRNNDLLSMLISKASQFLFWWNPIVYLMRKELSLAVEQIADEEAMSISNSRKEYAEWLVTYLGHCCSPNTSGLISTVNLFRSKSELVERTRYILRPPKVTSQLKSYLILSCIAITVLISLVIRTNQQKLDHFKNPHYDIR